MIRIHGLKNCDTCRKALSELKAAGHDASLRDVRAEPLSDAEITRFLTAFGDALVNRRSTTWRGLGDAERASDPKGLLMEYPSLMKRPVITAGDALYLGWTGETRAALL